VDQSAEVPLPAQAGKRQLMASGGRLKLENDNRWTQKSVLCISLIRYHGILARVDFESLLEISTVL